MDCDQPAQLLQSLTRHELLLLRLCFSLDHCVKVVSHANSILDQQCGRLVTDEGVTRREKLVLTEEDSTPKHRSNTSNHVDSSRIAAVSERLDQDKGIITAWKSRVSCLRTGVDGHNQCLKEVGQRLGLPDAQPPWNMHRRIYEKQQSLLRQTCVEFVDSTRSDMFRQLETRSSARPMDDRKVEALSEIEIFYAIRGYAADLEEQCIQNSQCNDASSAVASLEHLVSLHKNTVAGWSAGLVPKTDLQRWRTRALRCMGVHSTEDKPTVCVPEIPVGKHVHPKELLTAVDGFDATAVFRHMKLMHAIHSRVISSVDWCTATIPGIMWLPTEALAIMVTEKYVVDKESCNGGPAGNPKPISVLVAEPAMARAWLASLFQMQHLVAELYMLRTTAPDILQDSADIARELRKKNDNVSQSRIAWLARLLHSLLLPTSRCTLSIGKLCKE